MTFYNQYVAYMQKKRERHRTARA